MASDPHTPADFDFGAATTAQLQRIGVRFAMILLLGALLTAAVQFQAWMLPGPVPQHGALVNLAHEWLSAFQGTTAFVFTIAGAALLGIVVLTQQVRPDGAGSSSRDAATATTLWYAGVVFVVATLAVTASWMTVVSACIERSNIATAIGALLAGLIFAAVAAPPSAVPADSHEAVARYGRERSLSRLHKRLDDWPIICPRARHFVWTFVGRPIATTVVAGLVAVVLRGSVPIDDVISWTRWLFYLDIGFTIFAFVIAFAFAPDLGGWRWCFGILGWGFAAATIITMAPVAVAGDPVAARAIVLAAAARIAIALAPMSQPVPRPRTAYGARRLASVFRRRRLRKSVAALARS